MKGKRYSRGKKNVTPPVDMIGDLPGNLIETILCYLPLRDAIRTSILSRKWRYKWTYLPKLEFNYFLLPRHPKRTQLTTKELLLIIYRILLLQNTPTLDFSLDLIDLEPCDEVDSLVLHLSRNNVEKLTLRFLKGQYKLPKSLFSCSRLTLLDLTYCVFKPPLTFKGFSCLTILDFDNTSFNAETFGSFISSCPLLESLTLFRCTSLCFELSAPKLKSLYFTGNLDALYFRNVPLLAIVSIHPEADVITLGLIKFMESISVLKDLEMNCHFCKSLAAVGSDPEKLPTTLVRLRNLKLVDMSFGTLDEVLVVVCLIRSSPNLESFTIKMGSSVSNVSVEDVIWEDYSDLRLNRLRKVRIKGVSGAPSELEFIKFLLAKSPILERVRVKPRLKDGCGRIKILESVVRFKRTSPNAEIVFV